MRKQGPRYYPLPDSPVFADNQPMLTSGPIAVDALERTHAGSSYTFTLPDSWLHDRTVGLIAVVNPGSLTSESAVETCGNPCLGQPNVASLTDINLRQNGTVRVVPVAMLTTPQIAALQKNGTTPFGSPLDVLQAPQAVLPVQLQAPPLYTADTGGFVDIGDIASNNDSAAQKNAEVLDRLQSFEGGNPISADVVLGINHGVAYGLTRGDIFCGFLCLFHQTPVAVVEAARPLTSVSHELGHTLGLKHASSCTNGGDPGVFADWPPDQRGFIHGYGLNVAAGPPYGGAFDNSAYDLMSYCAPITETYQLEPDTWISVDNWQRVVNSIPNFPHGCEPCALGANDAIPSRRPSIDRNALSVSVVIDGGGTKILSIRPARPLPGLTGTGALHILAHNRSGHLIADVPLTVERLEINRGGTVSYGSASIPRSASDVVVVNGSQILAYRQRSLHAPGVKILSPRSGTTVRARGVTIRWRVSNSGHTDLVTALDYSPNDGRSWHQVYVGSNLDHLRLRHRAIDGSARARIRVRVNDGFNESVAVSSPFHVTSNFPDVVIVDPPAGRIPRFRQDAGLRLTAVAYADGMKFLTGGHVKWYDGHHLIGGGAKIALRGVRAGRHLIRIVVRDIHGLTATAAIRVEALPVAPSFIEITAPRHIRARARVLSLIVSASFPAKLTISGVRRQQVVSVDVRRQHLRLRVRGGRKALSVRLTLSANGLSTVRAVIIARQ